jgi:hypothetical protein
MAEERTLVDFLDNSEQISRKETLLVYYLQVGHFEMPMNSSQL